MKCPSLPGLSASAPEVGALKSPGAGRNGKGKEREVWLKKGNISHVVSFAEHQSMFNALMVQEFVKNVLSTRLFVKNVVGLRTVAKQQCQQ